MRASRMLVAIVATLSTPIVAQAASPAALFPQFKQQCIDPAAKPAKGWTRVDNLPAGLMAAYGGPFDRAVTWSRPAPDGDSYLLVSGVQKIDGGERRTCTLSGPADANAGAQARAWIGPSAQPVVGHEDDMASYLLIDARGAPRSATVEERRDSRNASRISGLAVATDADVTTLSFSSFTPTQIQAADRNPPIEIDRTIWNRPQR
jgi:hypothetical protein